jgi:hypothetical protein
MSKQGFAFGDRVRHAKRPEWGIGSVVKVEDAPVGGEPSQRVSVRFPNAGVKVLSTLHAELEHVAEPDTASPNGEETSAVAVWDRVRESDWLAGVAERKIEEAMIALPLEVRDPFRSMRQRLESTLALYRFERTGRGLVDWAVAQTGLNDPLSRFNRHELEQFFDRWAFERDAHLARLVQDVESDKALLEELSAKAPPAARSALRRRAAVR